MSELLTLVEKGGDITLTEKSRLDNELRLLAEIHQTTTGSLSPGQALFVRRVLPEYVRHQVPRLYQVMALYNLTTDTVFYHETEPFHGRF